MTTRARRVALGASLLTGLALAACSGGSAGDPSNRGPFLVTAITNGQGPIYPYRVRLVDSRGRPTTQIVNIENEATLRANVNADNDVLPIAAFPDTAVLPDGRPGNQFLLMRFSHRLEVRSILSDLLANATTNSGLTTAISLLAYDPNTERAVTLQGRGFVGGKTFFNRDGRLEMVQAVEADNDTVAIRDSEASGFPRGFTNDVDLVGDDAFVFVADSDGDLDTLETFDPLNRDLLIRIIVTNAVRDSDGDILEQEICTATTVGADPNPPQVLGFRDIPDIVPGNGQTGVDPTTAIRVQFNKPVQPADVGQFLSNTNLTPQPGGLLLNVTVSSQTFGIRYYADPASYGDLCNYVITPAYSLPGETTVEVRVRSTSINGLIGSNLGQDVTTTFVTGRGPGIINAPVSPDAIYVGIGGANPGLSVIDLNGFGQGTNGLDPDPVSGQLRRTPSETNFPRNPNIGQPGVVPSLAVGTSPLDAGSNGPLTLVQDTRGNTRLLEAPLVGPITDVHVGAPLDLVFNNFNINVNAGSQNQVNPVSQATQPGNCVTISPHPNPPRLIFPPPNLDRAIFGEEPTVTSSQGPVAFVQTIVQNGCITSPVNQLTNGSVPDYFIRLVEGVFFGPQPAPASPPPPPRNCPFTARQQIGHFLYVLDRENRQVLVLNSNRFTVLDRIRLSDPVAMTMSPNLGVLAVANFSSSSVSFIDIDPRSPAFNTVVAETRVPDGPSKIAWQPDGDAVLCISRPTSSLTVIRASDFQADVTVTGSLQEPIDLCVTERYATTGNLSGVYYAYILNSNGTVAVFESGPAGVNGIGFNDTVGTIDPQFRRATRIRLDYNAGTSGFYVAHVDERGVGVISRVDLTAGPLGPIPTQQNAGGFILPPTFRQKVWEVVARYGGSDPSVPGNQRLSGNSPIDFAFDEMFNNGAGTNQLTTQNAQNGVSIIGHSSKGSRLIGATGLPAPAFTPKFLFVALNDVGAIDVFDLETRVRVRTIQLPGVQSLSGYWKQ